jgi:hypothetical protein
MRDRLLFLDDSQIPVALHDRLRFVNAWRASTSGAGGHEL